MKPYSAVQSSMEPTADRATDTYIMHLGRQLLSTIITDKAHSNLTLLEDKIAYLKDKKGGYTTSLLLKFI